MRIRLFVLLIICTAGRAGTQSSPPAPLRIPAEVCYEFAYPDLSRTTRPAPNADLLYAQFAMLQPGTDSGGVRTGTAKRSQFWEMFLVGGRWVARRDSMQLRFSNGFSGVVYQLGRDIGDTISGSVRFNYDVVGQSPPPERTIGHRLPCTSAKLQSPRRPP
jgi:hypothetical protein